MRREFWNVCHRYAGLAILLFLAVAALSGMALCFTRDIDKMLNRDLFVEPMAAAAPAPVALLVQRFADRNPQWQLQSFPLAVPADERIPVTVKRPHAGAPNQIFLSRASGQLAGVRDNAASLTRRGFCEALLELHHSLLAGSVGRWLMAGVAGLWLFSNLIGVYLTLPRRLARRRRWSRQWQIRRVGSVSAMMRQLHVAPGLWLVMPLTVMAFTSLALNLFGEAWAPMVEALTPAYSAAPSPRDAENTPPRRLDFAGAVQAAGAVAARRGETWQPAWLEIEEVGQRLNVALTDNGAVNYHALGPINYIFDAGSGRLVEIYDPYRHNPRLASIRLLYPLHSGRILGLPGITLVFLTGLVTFGGCLTGLCLWWRKRGTRSGSASNL